MTDAVRRRTRSGAINFGTAAVVSVFLCSCGTRRYAPLEQGQPPPPLIFVPDSAPTNTFVPAPEVVVLPTEPVPVVGLDHIDAGPLPPGANAPGQASAPARGWIPLLPWANDVALGRAERLVQGAHTLYRLPTRTGPCVLTIGSRVAQWNGVTVWLGFAPRVVRGEPQIHALDAEKTLVPLMDSQAAPPTTVRTIVLDPGHGGSDSGTQSAARDLEKHLTLDWALRTERLLTNAGWRVFLTRRNDSDVPLAERVAFADRVRADLFVSLHFNSAAPQTQPSGIETYCVTPSGAPSTLLRGYADDHRLVYPNNAFDRANIAWAFRFQQAMLNETKAMDDGVKRARFMSVLRYQNRPAVLIEGGFLSNPADLARIRTADYRETLAQAVVRALQ